MSAENRPKAETSLNLLPVMNLVTILIPLLLMTSQLVQLAVLDSTQPAISDTVVPSPDPGFLLSLKVQPDGLVLGGSAEDLIDEPVLSCAQGRCQGVDSYPLEQLQAQLANIKSNHPDEQAIVLEPSGNIPYEVLIAVMDASRELDGRLLFPSPTISGGAPD
ncbi:MAG: biopolymer transporter ExbD [Myxococcota bacterium]